MHFACARVRLRPYGLSFAKRLEHLGRGRQSQSKKRPRDPWKPWKMIDDDDLDVILSENSQQIGADARRGLKEQINESIEIHNWLRHEKRGGAPHRLIKAVQRVQRAAETLYAALRDVQEHGRLTEGFECAREWIEREVRDGLVLGTARKLHDRHSSYQPGRSQFPKTSNLEAYFSYGYSPLRGGVAYSPYAPSAAKDIATLHLAAKFTEERERGRRMKLGSADTQPKQRDLSRYLFVESLATLYRRSFGVAPTSTEDGPWCRFLAKVLTCCEGKELKLRGAYDLWLAVKKEKLSDRLGLSVRPGSEP
jgi:hypothetical protein